MPFYLIENVQNKFVRTKPTGLGNGPGHLGSTPANVRGGGGWGEEGTHMLRHTAGDVPLIITFSPRSIFKN